MKFKEERKMFLPCDMGETEVCVYTDKDGYVAALQEISTFAVRVGFVNPDTGSDDETEFDVNSIFEALNLFRNDFREDNHWKEMPKILYIESVK